MIYLVFSYIYQAEAVSCDVYNLGNEQELEPKFIRPV